MRRAFVALVLLVAGLPVLAPGPAKALPGGFSFTTAFSGLSLPTAVSFAPNGRVFVAEKSGIIKTFDGLSDTTASVFADLSTQVYNNFDRGLLDVEVHPDFPNTPYVYALYTYDGDIGGSAPKWGTPGVLSDPCPDPPGNTKDGCVTGARLSRLQTSPSGDVMVGETVMIEDWCIQFPSHSIGNLTFGPDGALYVGGGDGALTLDWGHRGTPTNPCGDPPGGVGGTMEPPSAEGGALRSQDLRTPGDPVTLDGAILRVDPMTGAALPSNPQVGHPDANARRIIAYGLRNPFRFAFRPGTSEIYIGEVGDKRKEEINRIPNPVDSVVENFGWPCYEGKPRNPAFDKRDFTLCEKLYTANAVTAPVFDYDHSAPVYPGDPCARTGGAISALGFYPGDSNYPASFDGALFFGDYSRQCLWVMFRNASGVIDPATVQGFAWSSVGFPVDIKPGPGGDLFYVDIAGQIRRIQYFESNTPPIAQISADPTTGPVPLTVEFDGSASTDPDGGSLTYEWDLDGDGSYDDATGAQTTYVYTEPGDVTAGLHVRDPDGGTATASVVIRAGNSPPQPEILTPEAGTTWRVGDQITFSGQATDGEDGTLPDSALTWSLVFQHCPDECHEHFVQDFVGQSSGSFVVGDHEYPSYLELVLTATDSGGLQTTTRRALYPQTADVTLNSEPAGMQIGFGTGQSATPFTATAIVGSTISLAAISPQSLGGTPYEFSAWSDGGTRIHDIVVGESGGSYTATFVPASNTANVSITAGGYTPRNLAAALPTTVLWTNNGTSQHTVTDTSGMQLFDSGPLSPGATYSFEFIAAGRYMYGSTLDSFTGSVEVPMVASTTSPPVGEPVEITWASGAPPTGYLYDVQIRRPGEQWTSWIRGTAATAGAFTPDAPGTVEFRSRIRRTSNNRSCLWSNPLEISDG